MPIEIRAKLKPFIIILIIITILVAGFFITRSFLNNKRFEAVSGIDSESFNNEIESDTTIDDIFGDNITKEEKDFLSTNNNIAPIDTNAAIDTNSLPYPIQLDNNGLYEVNTNNIPDISPTKPKVNTFPKKDSPYVYDNTSSTVDNQNVRISSFIINYNDRFIASRSNPLLITLAVKTPPQGKFARIRVYARRIDDNYNKRTYSYILIISGLIIYSRRSIIVDIRRIFFRESINFRFSRSDIGNIIGIYFVYSVVV